MNSVVLVLFWSYFTQASLLSKYFLACPCVRVLEPKTSITPCTSTSQCIYSGLDFFHAVLYLYSP